MVPGPRGADGTNGAAGEAGESAYTSLTAAFTMPAEGASASAEVASSAWMTVGQVVFVQFLGFMEVTAIADPIHATLKNLEDAATSVYLSNAPAGTIAPIASMVSPSGTQGPAGTPGAPTNVTYITQTPNATLTNEQALSTLATGYAKITTGTGVVGTQAVPIPVADGGTGGTTPAAARTALAAAPSAAKYITQVADAELSAEQALSALATGYMQVTTGTGVISSQAVPIPVADGGTGATTAAGIRAGINVLSGYGILGFKDNVDLNVPTSDNAITMLSARYRIEKFTLESPSAAVTTATMGIFTAAGGAGTTLAADQVLAATLTATTKFMDLVNAGIVATDTRTEGTLYARIGTAEGAARTVSIKIFGWKFD